MIRVLICYGWRKVNIRASLNIESNHSYWKGTVILSRYTMILKRNCQYFDNLSADDLPCEVDVADNHDVEMSEQLQLFQAHCSLAIS